MPASFRAALAALDAAAERDVLAASHPKRGLLRVVAPLVGSAIALGACATFGRSGPPRAVAARPMTFACPSLAPGAFSTRAVALLRDNGWTLREADSTRGVVRGTRGPVYAGLGENLTADGPYLLSTAHDGRTANVSVQIVETYQHRVVPIENLNDDSDDADRRNFLFVVDGLRRACGAPTSGRTPEPTRQPTLPPPSAP